jgi:hypothetical protein
MTELPEAPEPVGGSGTASRSAEEQVQWPGSAGLRRVFAALMVLAALSVLGLMIGSVIVASRRESLAGDRGGAEACAIVDRWLRQGRVEDEFHVSSRAAMFAYNSSTEAIRSTVVVGIADSLRSDGTCCDGEHIYSVDLRRLRNACADAGVDLPPF